MIPESNAVQLYEPSNRGEVLCLGPHGAGCNCVANGIDPACPWLQEAAAFTEGNVRYLREKYATGFITLCELEIGLESVLLGGPVNVPFRSGEE